MKRIHLTEELAYNGLTVEKAIANRRSQRDFRGETISLAELSHLLYYSSGVTDKRYGLRAAPSAGATYPIEVAARLQGRDSVFGRTLPLALLLKWRHRQAPGFESCSLSRRHISNRGLRNGKQC